jgi:hypothetical protein
MEKYVASNYANDVLVLSYNEMQICEANQPDLNRCTNKSEDKENAKYIKKLRQSVVKLNVVF